jgi:plastocyanin
MRGVWITALRVTAVALMTLVFALPAAAAPGAGAAPATGAAGSAATSAAQQSLEDNRIVDFGFEPTELAVNIGDSVTWTNTGERPHTVTDRANTFDTDAIVPGASGTVEFTVPGTYFFFCRINPGSMNGVITVAPGDQPSNTNRVQAVDDGREGEQLRFDPPELSVPAGSFRPAPRSSSATSAGSRTR